jgi:hypothetical protein
MGVRESSHDRVLPGRNRECDTDQHLELIELGAYLIDGGEDGLLASSGIAHLR